MSDTFERNELTLKNDIITLAHGSGGSLTQKLINDVFYKYFSNDILKKGDDSAILNFPQGKMAFTTDSFVITPIFFKGGDIGKLAICGTVNDIVTSGAIPLYLSCGFIIEEGMLISDVERIAISMGETAIKAGVKIVTGDTKVVENGAADQIYINTSGIGVISEGVDISCSNAKEGDCVIITGTIADHGCSIMIEREKFEITSHIESDCTVLNGLIGDILAKVPQINVLRDPTRGGVATALNEIAAKSDVSIMIDEEKIPLNQEVDAVCEMLGMDPLYMANEGKMLIIVPQEYAIKALDILKKHELGVNASIIGEVVKKRRQKVFMKTLTGGFRIVDVPVGVQLPRIC